MKIFFFSSRRRHTRLVSDWSSDVCSSDLVLLDLPHTKRPLQSRQVTSRPRVRSPEVATRLGRLVRKVEQNCAEADSNGDEDQGWARSLLLARRDRKSGV